MRDTFLPFLPSEPLNYVVLTLLLPLDHLGPLHFISFSPKFLKFSKSPKFLPPQALIEEPVRDFDSSIDFSSFCKQITPCMWMFIRQSIPPMLPKQFSTVLSNSKYEIYGFFMLYLQLHLLCIILWLIIYLYMNYYKLHDFYGLQVNSLTLNLRFMRSCIVSFDFHSINSILYNYACF